MRQMRKLAPLVTDPEVEDYIQQLGRSLSDHTDYHNEFEFFVIDSNVVNAFAVPGGFVAFHTGLILRTENESELASVMGHEIVHVTQRHGARGIEAGRRMNMPAMAAMFAAIALTAIDPEAGAAAIMATQAAAQQFQINFTRSNEKEADALGIRLVAAAGYDTRKMADFFEKTAKQTKNYPLLSNWLIGEVSAYLNKELIEINESKLSVDNVATLINRIDDQTISGKIAKTIFEEMCINGASPDEIIESQGLKQISDDGAIEKIIDTVIKDNAAQVEAYLQGKDKLFGFFVGQVMKLTQGKANPKAVNTILKDKLKN